MTAEQHRARQTGDRFGKVTATHSPEMTNLEPHGPTQKHASVPGARHAGGTNKHQHAQ